MADDNNNEVFIDADSGFANEKNSYETIILNQINACVKALSREMTGGQVIHKAGPTGVEKYIEDVREVVINSVDTLRMLLSTYLKDNKSQIEVILQEIEDKKNELLESKRIIPGKGVVSLKNIVGVNVEDPMWKEFIQFKANKYREIFEILVISYNQEKAHIRSLEEE